MRVLADFIKRLKPMPLPVTCGGVVVPATQPEAPVASAKDRPPAPFDSSRPTILPESAETAVGEQRFRELAEAIGAVFWMTDPAKSQMIYVSLGYEKIWGRSCASLYASPREWSEAIHAEDRPRVLEALARQQTGDYNVEYRIVRPDGSIRWIRDRAFPIHDEAGKVSRITGIAEDITERKRLEKQIIEISDREQQRLGLDLHDGICQQLVSIAFATDLLRRDLVAKSPHDAVRLGRITALLDNAILQARHLSHALYPVNLVGNGLGFALRELASSVSQARKIVCEAQCQDTVSISDHALATHLYRIAQEAVQNAIKHADPSRILITLTQEADTVHLSVTDNGVGAEEERNFGVGLSIMKYRADMAGGRLEIGPGPNAGTMISVSVRLRDEASSQPLDPKAPEHSSEQREETAAPGKLIPCEMDRNPAYYAAETGLPPI